MFCRLYKALRSAGGIATLAQIEQREADRGSSFGATYDLQMPRSVNRRLANTKSEGVQDKGCQAPHTSYSNVYVLGKEDNVLMYHY